MYSCVWPYEYLCWEAICGIVSTYFSWCADVIVVPRWGWVSLWVRGHIVFMNSGKFIFWIRRGSVLLYLGWDSFSLWSGGCPRIWVSPDWVKCPRDWLYRILLLNVIALKFTVAVARAYIHTFKLSTKI